MAKITKRDVTTKSPTRQMWRRSAIILVVLVGFCFSAVVGKLVMLQIVETDQWQKLAVSQQLSDSIISPKRGSIYDTNGKILVQSTEVWTVILSPKDIPSDEMRVTIADELSALLEVDREKLYTKTQKVNSQYEVIKSKIERPLMLQLSDWIQEHKLAGVIRIILDYKRYYHYNNLLAPVLGFTGTENTGLYGLEAKYEDVLGGKPGRIVTAKNGWGDELPTNMKYEKTVDAEDGNSLVLTIDSVIQSYAEKYLEVAVKETGCTNRGAAIVMDVNTGAILAMATKGDFDPNQPFEIADPDTKTALAQLSGDEQSAALKKAREEQWVNKPISDFYEPGSVFKMFTVSMALEEGLVSEKSSFTCTGSVLRGGWTMKCHIYPRSHGTQLLPKALSNSCNPAFIQIGEKVGNKLFFKYYTGFGFTSLTGIDMLSESRVTSLLYHPESGVNGLDGPTQLASSSIGQTFKVTPIQMIAAVSAVANGGKLMQPYVVKQIADSDGNVIKNMTPVVKRQVISAETSQRVRVMMADSVNGGGSKNAYVAGYRVAGKTGTADKTDQKNEKNVVASFAGLAPADDPKIAVLVLLDEPHSAIRYGGTISAPVAQKILESTLPYLGVEPKYTDAEREALSRSTPNVTDKAVDTAKALLTNSELKVTVVGEGGKVLKQVPEAGQPIPTGGMVVLYTDEGSLSKTVTVPDFKGKTLAQANTAAVNAGLNLQFSGLSMSEGDPKATTQSVAAGTKVPQGTVVTVDFVYDVADDHVE